MVAGKYAASFDDQKFVSTILLTGLLILTLVSLAPQLIGARSSAIGGASFVTSSDSDASCFPGQNPCSSISSSATLSTMTGDVGIVALMTAAYGGLSGSPSISDSALSSFTLVASIAQSDPSGELFIYTTAFSSSISDTLMVSFSSASNGPMWLNVGFYEVSGVSTDFVPSVTGSGSCMSCTISTTSPLAAPGGSFFFGVVSGQPANPADTITAGSGFTLDSPTQASTSSGTLPFRAEYQVPVSGLSSDFPMSFSNSFGTPTWIEAGILLFASSGTTTVTSLSTTTSTVTSTLTSVTTSTQTIQPTLLIETRTSSGSGISTQVTLTGSDSFTRTITTDSSGNYLFGVGVLTEGVTYTASATINTAPLSASVTLGGNSVIVLEPTPSPFPTPQFPLGVLASLLVGMVALAIYALRKHGSAVRENSIIRIKAL